MNEESISNKLKSMPIFEHLHNEKMSPVFLKLARGASKTTPMLEIRDNAGNVFNSDQDRKKFMVEEYERIYVPDNNIGPIGVEQIADFLGAEICNSNLVRECILNDDESNTLEGEITLAELDKAISKCKLNSAGGTDGINNRFLKRFWHLLRIPLVNYANCCFNKGLLTDSFKGAAIKLIPKKGDNTKLKNWRPISLLNCAYKLLSKCINNRLKKVTDKILSRAQKGFTDKRFCQEVLINVIEKIAYAIFENIKGIPVVVTIDQAKAFDKIWHDFMDGDFEFFGIKPGFRRMMETAGNNRVACLMFDDGTLSQNFDLKSGRPQGDGPSPLQYNIGQQILLFKIELDPVFSGIFWQHVIPRPALNANLPAIRGSNIPDRNGER